jgi:hypothetical protein
MTTVHRQGITLEGVDHSWDVDGAAAARVADWAARAPHLLQADLEGMGSAFPHWLLTGARGGQPAACARCRAPLVPTTGGLRCLRCGSAGQADGLLWMGHLPSLARPEPTFAARRRALRQAGFGEAQVGETVYLLVPLTARYPDEWPNVEPRVRYAHRWLEALGLPRSSAVHHLVQEGRACLYGWGEWQVAPMHSVLQQRVVNHVASLLKVAAGRCPAEAFIGRGHHTAGLRSG